MRRQYHSSTFVSLGALTKAFEGIAPSAPIEPKERRPGTLRAPQSTAASRRIHPQPGISHGEDDADPDAYELKQRRELEERAPPPDMAAAVPWLGKDGCWYWWVPARGPAP